MSQDRQIDLDELLAEAERAEAEAAAVLQDLLAEGPDVPEAPPPPVEAEAESEPESEEGAEREPEPEVEVEVEVPQLERLEEATDSRQPLVRTHDERRRAVIELIESATPEREVRSPKERRDAVRRVLEDRERKRNRKIRTEQERRRAVAELIQEQAPKREVRTPEERRADHEAALAAAMKDRKPRTYAQRIEDARRAAMDELEARRQHTIELNARLEAKRAAADLAD